MMNNKQTNNGKLKSAFIAFCTALLFSGNILAGVYKCSDKDGNTAYQSAPCAEENKAIKIDIKSGGKTDITAKKAEKEKNKAAEIAQKKQKESEQQRLIDLEVKRKKQAAIQRQHNQQLIKNNPIQFSAFAIPPYLVDDLPALVKKYEARLPEIEKFRRLAALKALATKECIRVEADELSVKSKTDKLVFSVDCSSAKTFYYTESELLK